MPWGRFGDNAGMFPQLLAATAREDAPDGAYPMMFGFLCLLTASSTAFNTDYVVTLGNVRQAGGEHWRWLLDAAVKAKLLTKQRGKVHGVDAYTLVQDKNFLHIRLKAEVEWEEQQRSDTLRVELVGPVRRRDGDQCRYCANLVHWMGPKSPRKAPIDHLRPGEAGTVDTLVVACLQHNSQQKDLRGEERLQLLDPPLVPFYSETTATFLTKKCGLPTAPTEVPSSDDSDPAPAEHRASDTARQRPAQADTARAADSDPDTGHRAATSPRSNAPPGESQRPSLTSQVERSDSPGTGRDGTGSSRSSSHPTDPAAPTPARRRRRSTRGGHRPTEGDG